MLKPLLALAAAITVASLLGSAAVSAATERSFDKSLTVSGPVALSLHTGSGDVHVQAGSDNQVHIVARVRGSNTPFSSDVEQRIQQIISNPPIRQMGSVIEVGPDRNDPLYRNISISYDVTTPKQTALNASSGSGSVRVADLAQQLTAQSGSGDVEATNIGSRINLQTGSGSVRAQGISGEATLQTGSGDIELHEMAAGPVRAQTGSGSIRLNGVNGSLNAQTGSGDITAAGQIASDWRFHTGSGSVHANVGSNARFTLDADTGSGSVHLEQPITMQGKINPHHINGTVNGGGPEMRVQTGSGDITIQ